jgi:Tfp pilus assembly protein PilE
MGVIDLLVTIIVVTILVTIALGVMTYIAYKLRLSRRPAMVDEDASGNRYFVLHQPPGALPPTGEGHVA